MFKNIILGLAVIYPLLCFGATELKDEGVSKGYINRIDCVGDGIACSRSGITGTFSVSKTSPAGSDEEVQFNDSGSFGSDANFKWDKTKDILEILSVTYDLLIGQGVIGGGSYTGS